MDFAYAKTRVPGLGWRKALVAYCYSKLPGLHQAGWFVEPTQPEAWRKKWL